MISYGMEKNIPPYRAHVYRPYLYEISDEEVRGESVKALVDAVEIVGSASELARMIGVSRQQIYRFQHETKRGVSPKFVLPIERATGGIVSRNQLRMDLYPTRR